MIASSIVVAATFFLLPTLGEIITERSGVLNLGIEGMMISGAAGSFAVAYTTGNIVLGLIAGMLIGGALALLHGIVTITFNRNQVVSGISLTIFGTGLSGLLGLGFAGLPLVPLQPIIIPGLSAIPFLGAVFFNKNILVYFSFIMVPVLWFFLYRTRYGIIVRTVGENPIAAYTQGINVNQVRYLCVIFGGMMCGLGGAYLTLGWIPLWVEGMTNAKGWIVIAIVVVGLWHPVGILFGAYIFAAFEVLQFTFQPLGIAPAFLNMLPSLTTILVLVIYLPRRIIPGGLRLVYRLSRRIRRRTMGSWRLFAGRLSRAGYGPERDETALDWAIRIESVGITGLVAWTEFYLKAEYSPRFAEYDGTAAGTAASEALKSWRKIPLFRQMRALFGPGWTGGFPW